MTEEKATKEEVIELTPQHIREGQAGFKDYEMANCNECGYNGYCGVKKRILPWFGSFWFIIPVAVMLAPLGGLGVIFAICLGGARVLYTRYLIVCPNCKSELLKK